MLSPVVVEETARGATYLGLTCHGAALPEKLEPGRTSFRRNVHRLTPASSGVERSWNRGAEPKPPNLYFYSYTYRLCIKMRSHEVRRIIGAERSLSGLPTPEPVLSPTRITTENNGKIRPRQDRKNAFARASGGQRGIRTLETVPRLHTFQACAFDHSANRPCASSKQGRRGLQDQE